MFWATAGCGRDLYNLSPHRSYSGVANQVALHKRYIWKGGKIQFHYSFHFFPSRNCLYYRLHIQPNYSTKVVKDSHPGKKQYSMRIRNPHRRAHFQLGDIVDKLSHCYYSQVMQPTISYTCGNTVFEGCR
jgi:hypothetical protein